MPCVQTQYGTLPYENTYFNSEFLNPDFTAKLVMDLSSQTEQLAASSLPSINTLVGNYSGEFDAFSCQIPPAPSSSSSAQAGAEASSPHGQQSPLKLDDLQVYGCYPGTFALSYLDETLSSCGSDYYGSPLSAAASPPTPGYQTQQVSAWDSPFTPYSPGPGCWVSDKPSLPQAPSFFTFNTPVEQPSPLDASSLPWARTTPSPSRLSSSSTLTSTPRHSPTGTWAWSRWPSTARSSWRAPTPPPRPGAPRPMRAAAPFVGTTPPASTTAYGRARDVKASSSELYKKMLSMCA